MAKPTLRLRDGRTISYKDLPEGNSDLVSLDVDYPSLLDVQLRRFSTFEKDLVEYLQREGETIERNDLRFLRSALLNDRMYWIWEFTTPEGDECYATVSLYDNRLAFGYDQNWDGLSAEQFLLADYFDCL